jgi:hypothetical protein
VNVAGPIAVPGVKVQVPFALNTTDPWPLAGCVSRVRVQVAGQESFVDTSPDTFAPSSVEAVSSAASGPTVTFTVPDKRNPVAGSLTW